ncbi:Cyclin-dependent kinase inhibitor [Desmophyllum pertusum]|uniref:Cyclin-dependent kinase inhibitor n=1 Tax=Desmophyllum pertusum TaxID=174260 RepID=A0A9W9YBY2_9CNID|nr:Cyclin-dependent kinase inhibitor [Desmophyllum pertusum]
MNPEASNAKRCLFGQPDHEELEKDLQRELSEDAKEMNEKYEFDFQEGKPLEGGTKYEWEEVVEPPPKEKAGARHDGGSSVEMANKEMTAKATKSVEEQPQATASQTPEKNPR